MIAAGSHARAGVLLVSPLTLVLYTLLIDPGEAYGQAATELHARSRGHGDASAESVRSAYAAGRDQEAVLLADQALVHLAGTDSPAGLVAEIHFWRGAALRRLGRLEEARIALDAAHRLGLAAPELRLERALAKRALGQEAEAKQEYQEAERLLPPGDERRSLFADRWKREGKGEPAFQLSVTPQVGYDSNIVGLEKDAPLLGGDLDEDSAYTGLVLGGKTFLVQNDRQVLALEYVNQMRAYLDESDFNYSDNILSGTGRHPFLDGADLEVRGAWGEAFTEDEGHLRTTRTVAAAFLLYPSSSWQARLWADGTDADYYVSDIPNEQDRDGILRRGGLILGFDLGGGWSVAPHLGLAITDSDGDDYDHEDLILGVTLTTAQVLGTVLSPAISYTRADYEHENSVVGFTEKREDRIWRYALSVTFRDLESLIGYAPRVTVAFLDHSSNLDPYDYERWEPRVEMTIVAVSF